MDETGEEYSSGNPWLCKSPPVNNGPASVTLSSDAQGLVITWVAHPTLADYVFGYKVSLGWLFCVRLLGGWLQSGGWSGCASKATFPGACAAVSRQKGSKAWLLLFQSVADAQPHLPFLQIKIEMEDIEDGELKLLQRWNGACYYRLQHTLSLPGPAAGCLPARHHGTQMVAAAVQ